MRSPLWCGLLPYPPSSNRYWRVFRGRAVRSREAKAYIEGVRRLLGHVKPTAAEVAVELEVIRPARRGDLDNRLKVVLDALRGLVYEDDRQVVELHAWRMEAPRTKRGPPPVGGVYLRAYEVTPAREVRQDEVDPSDWERP